jgi:2-iminobutanoate/2-iminopropanoate deaminase
MQSRRINPWQWQDQFGFSQAVEVPGGRQVLYCAGQASLDAEGRPVHAGDMGMQIKQAMDNLETLLRESGYDLASVVRFTIYTTDVDQLFASYGELAGRLARAGVQPAMTLLGVTRLAFPEMMVEIEATAVK